MRTYKCLDLCSGAGGAGMGYLRSGFEVVGVDILPQPRYPAAAEFIQADALTFPLDGFDFVHASPPCQRWSRITTDAHKHPDLITPLRERLITAGVPYVIENVPGAPLIDPIRLCGSSFGLDVRRHRLFESNMPLFAMDCRHEWQRPRFKMYEHGRWRLSSIVPVYGTGGWKAEEYWGSAMGIRWMVKDELKESIPPAFTEFVGRQVYYHLTEGNAV